MNRHKQTIHRKVNVENPFYEEDAIEEEPYVKEEPMDLADNIPGTK